MKKLILLLVMSSVLITSAVLPQPTGTKRVLHKGGLDIKIQPDFGKKLNEIETLIKKNSLIKDTVVFKTANKNLISKAVALIKVAKSDIEGALLLSELRFIKSPKVDSLVNNKTRELWIRCSDNLIQAGLTVLPEDSCLKYHSFRAIALIKTRIKSITEMNISELCVTSMVLEEYYISKSRTTEFYPQVKKRISELAASSKNPFVVLLVQKYGKI